MLKKNILVLFGTRPEAIKLVPVIKELKNNSDFFTTTVCVTGQHREMLDQILSFFEIFRPVFITRCVVPVGFFFGSYEEK